MSTDGRRADAIRNRRLALDAATTLLAEPGSTLTVETIAKRAGLGAGTVVRAFGGKDALLDAAVAALLGPVVRRGDELLAHAEPEPALRTFLAELVAFQAAHYAIDEQLGGLDLPATAALHRDLERVIHRLIDGARRVGAIRTDLDPGLITTLIAETAHGIARFQPPSGELAAAFVTVLLDGLRPKDPFS